MKIQLVIGDGTKIIELKPESPEEAALLAALAPHNTEQRAVITGEYDRQRPPYRTLLVLKVAL